ncbi:MAG: hypothetical protein PHE24_02690 [Patescibacteria group bacterium]|nr:hypothetical protein [Patescibacteria group bacterium]
MASTIIFIVQAIILFIVLFFIFIILRELLFFGFAPFLQSHPEVMEKILEQIEIRDDYVVYSLGYGRSGFLWAVEKKFPTVKLVGVDDSLWHCTLARLQIFFRGSRIKVKCADYYLADIKGANVVYCYLDVQILREIYKKLRVEPRAGAIIISSGFIIPFLEPIKVLKTEPKKRWFNFLIGGEEKVLTEKEKEYKPDKNIYYYEV